MDFVRKLNNITRDSGKSVKLNCEVTGEPPPLRIQWYMNEVPVAADGGGGSENGNGNGEKKSKPRMTVKRFQSRHKNGLGSRLRINRLEVHDTGFFTCEATNGIEKINSTAILIVKVNPFSELNATLKHLYFLRLLCYAIPIAIHCVCSVCNNTLCPSKINLTNETVDRFRRTVLVLFLF